MYDVIIIGGGPAGLTAAVYCRRANKTVLIFERDGFGGQMTHSPKIENYSGYLEISGAELADRMFEQAISLGADIEIDEVVSVTPGKPIKVGTTGGTYECKALILATGAKHRCLNVPGEEHFTGNGVSYCAVCDGAFYADKDVAVIGGGNSALVEAVSLSKTCKSVTIIQDLPTLTGEMKLQKLLESEANVKIVTSATVLSFPEGETFTGVEIQTQNGTETIKCDGCFVAIGLAADNGFVKDTVTLDRYGCIKADESCISSSEGIFAAGDCRSKKIRQITTATADGATAALAACEYAEAHERNE